MVRPSLTVLAVLWVGEFRGRPYRPEWVRRLRNMVARNLDRPHRFVCLSNVEVEGVETIPLRHDWPGWWSKVELFRSDLGIRGRCLYLDLDTLVVSALDEIADYPSPMAFCPPAYQLAGGPIPPCTDGRHGKVVNLYNSSVIAWNAGEGREIYDEFTGDVPLHFRGDQDWMGHVSPGRDLMPKEWFAKLRYFQDGPNDRHKVLMSMPWKCEEAAQKFGWVREIWR